MPKFKVLIEYKAEYYEVEAVDREDAVQKGYEHGREVESQTGFDFAVLNAWLVDDDDDGGSAA